jgi:hypothetical protein
VDFDTWREYQTKSIRLNEMFLLLHISKLQREYEEQKNVNMKLQRSIDQLVQVVGLLAVSRQSLEKKPG